MGDPDQARKEATEVIRAAGEVGGGLTGATIGLIVGGPPGAVGGALAGALVKVGADFLHRQLSRKQLSRVGSALHAADQRAYHRIMSGDPIRDDDFFAERPDGNSPAEELADAVLHAVQNQSEERKAPHLGYLIANIAFEPHVDARTAHELVQEAESLSFTQFVLLAAVARNDEFPLPGRPDPSVEISREAATVLSQLNDLGYARRELVGVPRPERGLATNLGVPKDLGLRDRGQVLVDLLELARIPDEEISRVVDLLWEASGAGGPPG